MSQFNINETLQGMLSAAQGVLSKEWPNIQSFAVNEFKKIAQDAELLALMTLAGQIPEEQAKLLLQMQINASKSVLLTIEGLGLLMVEAAFNAAMAVLSTAVSKTIGVVLI